MNPEVIFDITQKTYNWSLVVIELLFVISGMVRSARRTSAVFLIVFGIIVGLGSLLFQFSNRQEYETILRNGQASVVEGKIENFHPMPEEGNDLETFTVNGMSFAYSDFSITPAFNNTSSHGGPLKNGMAVKIYYTDSRELRGEYAILRIEESHR